MGYILKADLYSSQIILLTDRYAAIDALVQRTRARGIIEGKTVTTVAKCAMDAQQGGAEYVDRECVIDGNIVSARTWHDNTALMREFLKLLSAQS